MTEQEQREEIAKACGWTLRTRVFHNGKWQDVPTWFAPKFREWPEDSCPAGQWIGAGVPNYLQDLNAMHEAENHLDTASQSQIPDYCRFVWLAMKGSRESYFGTMHATAKHRAEAFLKTIGKWRD